MLPVAHARVHRHLPLGEPPSRIRQDKARPQASPQVPIRGLCTVDLAGIGGQERLQGTAHRGHPVTPRPQPPQARGLERCSATAQGQPIRTGLVDDEPRARALGRALGPPPGLAPVRGVEALPQGPSVLLLHHIRPLALAAILQGKGRGGCAWDPAGALMGVGHRGHPWRVTAPASGPHQRGWQVATASVPGCQALRKPALSPAERGAAPPPWSVGMGADAQPRRRAPPACPRR